MSKAKQYIHDVSVPPHILPDNLQEVITVEDALKAVEIAEAEKALALMKHLEEYMDRLELIRAIKLGVKAAEVTLNEVLKKHNIN